MSSSTGVVLRNDSKSLGTCVWPSQQDKCSFLIGIDLVFRKGSDLYGYQLLSSTECVRVHLVKKQLKIELGVPFPTFNGDVLEEDLEGWMIRSVIQLISSNWSYGNWTEGADQFFIKTRLLPKESAWHCENCTTKICDYKVSQS